MALSHEKFRKSITMDGQIDRLYVLFSSVADTRSSNRTHSMPDILMSGYAMFALKHPSLLSFEQQTRVEQQNLKQIYGIRSFCSDAQLRRVLDRTGPGFIRDYLADGFDTLEQAGIIRDYRYKIGGTGYLIVSCDGTQHFSSKSRCCDKCLKKQHRDGSITYHHNMLCASLVHPDNREVFVLDGEAVLNTDGAKKNDCEINASKRLLRRFDEKHRDRIGKHRFLVVEDALFANCPHIEDLRGKRLDYLINVKPDSHKTLFGQVGSRSRRGLAKQFEMKENGQTHQFKYANNLRLANSGEVRVNFLEYTFTDTKGKSKTFTWISDIKFSKANVYPAMRAARARWKIENETFNTLKNLGYRFEHNYGHGNDHLSSMFAYLMLLAFWTDQLIQAVNRTFQLIEQGIKTKVKLWESIRAVFHTSPMTSMRQIYLEVAHLFDIQIPDITQPKPI